MTKVHINSNNGLETDQTKPVQVLLVEDDPANQWLATSMLEDAGCSVRCATNGQDAVSMVGKNSFDIVLMDLGLPLMNGIQATKMIRNEEVGSGRRIPILALSALDWDGDKKQSLDAGMDDFLSKPVNRKELLNKIVEYVPKANELKTDMSIRSL